LPLEKSTGPQIRRRDPIEATRSMNRLSKLAGRMSGLAATRICALIASA